MRASVPDNRIQSAQANQHAVPAAHPVVRKLAHKMEQLAVWTTTWVGSSWAFTIASVLVIAWLVTGPVFHYSNTWQLVMNTISSIVTFLMVFLIQRSQNKDTLAMQVKLNEIVAALKGASNRLINVEDLSEDQVRDLHHRYQELARLAQQSERPTQRLSMEQEMGHAGRPGEAVGR